MPSSVFFFALCVKAPPQAPMNLKIKKIARPTRRASQCQATPISTARKHCRLEKPPHRWVLAVKYPRMTHAHSRHGQVSEPPLHLPGQGWNGCCPEAESCLWVRIIFFRFWSCGLKSLLVGPPESAVSESASGSLLRCFRREMVVRCRVRLFGKGYPVWIHQIWFRKVLFFLEPGNEETS